MSRIAYVNGDYTPMEEARVSVLDRGFTMADAVYEVVSILDGKLVDFEGHWIRLLRSLDELAIPHPMSRDELIVLFRRLVAENALNEGRIYLQVTRGVEERDFAWGEGLTPTVVAFTQEAQMVGAAAAERGIKVISIEDQRWGRRDIKTTQLLYPAMGKMMAKKAGADDAWMVENGVVTEGTSNNAWIVKDGRLITRERSNNILHGITRAAVLRLAEELQMSVEERGFTIAEAKDADEAFVTSASAIVMPVVELDKQPIGNGQVGNAAKRLREIYLDEARKTAI